MWRLLALALLPTTSPFPSSVGCGEALEVGQFCFCAWLAVAVAGAAKRHKTPSKPLAPHRPSDSEIALKEVNTPINEREAAP